jgi:hypothetical protein
VESAISEVNTNTQCDWWQLNFTKKQDKETEGTVMEMTPNEMDKKFFQKWTDHYNWPNIHINKMLRVNGGIGKYFRKIEYKIFSLVKSINPHIQKSLLNPNTRTLEKL